MAARVRRFASGLASLVGAGNFSAPPCDGPPSSVAHRCRASVLLPAAGRRRLGRRRPARRDKRVVVRRMVGFLLSLRRSRRMLALRPALPGAAATGLSLRYPRHLLPVLLPRARRRELRRLQHQALRLRLACLAPVLLLRLPRRVRLRLLLLGAQEQVRQGGVHGGGPLPGP